MSLMLKPEIPVYKAPFLTLVAGASILNAFRNLGVDAEIKWPNDIVLNGQKICGILTEMVAEVEKVGCVVIGMGINVNTMLFPGELSEKATSLKKEGFDIKRTDIIREIMKEFEGLYNLYIEGGSREDIIGICRKYSVLIGKDVYLIKKDHREKVYCMDISNDGNLIVKHNDGEIEEIISGEVSVRGQNGYI